MPLFSVHYKLVPYSWAQTVPVKIVDEDGVKQSVQAEETGASIVVYRKYVLFGCLGVWTTCIGSAPDVEAAKRLMAE